MAIKSIKPCECNNDFDKQNQKGMAYLSLLLILALLAIAASASMTVSALAQRRIAEEELLFIGTQFQMALRSYANATPPGGSRHPRSFDELLRDTRGPVIRRHLRKAYVDPLTRSNDWGKVLGEGNGILSIYSLSIERPIKIADFPMHYKQFNNAVSYREWVFEFKD